MITTSQQCELQSLAQSTLLQDLVLQFKNLCANLDPQCNIVNPNHMYVITDICTGTELYPHVFLALVNNLNDPNGVY